MRKNKSVPIYLMKIIFLLLMRYDKQSDENPGFSTAPLSLINNISEKTKRIV